MHGCQPGEPSMPHRCARCGKEYQERTALLEGCGECGGRKFYFVPSPGRADTARKSGPGKAAPPPQPEHPKEESPPPPTPRLDPLESIRILSPGSYELNIEKLAQSDERVVGLGSGEGSYLVDLLSMIKPKKGRKRKK